MPFGRRPAQEHARARAPRSPRPAACSASRRSWRASGPTSDAGARAGRPSASRRHLLHEQLLEALAHRLHHDEALGRDAALPAVDEARGDAGLGRQLEVGVLQHQVGVAAAQLQHRLLERMARPARPPPGRRACCRSASPPCTCGRVDDRAPRAPTRPAACGRAGSGKPASRKISSMASAQPVTLEACLSRPALPAMSAGAAKRNTCQNGKVPGHDREHGARAARRRRSCGDASVGDGLVGQEAARRGRRSSRQTQAHFSISARPAASGLPISRAMSRASSSRRASRRSAAARIFAARTAKRGAAPARERAARLQQRRADVLFAVLRVLADQLAVHRVDGLERHEPSLGRPALSD